MLAKGSGRVIYRGTVACEENDAVSLSRNINVGIYLTFKFKTSWFSSHSKHLILFAIMDFTFRVWVRNSTRVGHLEEIFDLELESIFFIC